MAWRCDYLSNNRLHYPERLEACDVFPAADTADHTQLPVRERLLLRILARRGKRTLPV